MGRLRKDFVERMDAYADRILDVVNAIRHRRCPGFVRDQLGRSGTSVGANACEADEAATVAEFRHCLGIALRELAESKYWLRMVARRAWVKPERLTGIQDEAAQITRIIVAILKRSNPARADSQPHAPTEPETPDPTI